MSLVTINSEDKLSHAAEFIDRTTPENFRILRAVDGAYLLSMLQSETILSYLEQLSSHSERGGQNWLFKSFGMGIEKYFSGEYFDILAFAIQHKNKDTLQALATAVFDGTVQFWYGTDMRINSGLYTDQGHITDQGLFMYSGLMDTQAVPGSSESLVSNVASVSIMMSYRLDDETHLPTIPVLSKIDSLIEKYRDFIPFVIPARCMFFFAQELNLYISDNSHVGVDLIESPFTDPDQVAILAAMSDVQLSEIYKKVDLASSTIIQSATKTVDRLKEIQITVRGESTRFRIKSEDSRLSDFLIQVTCPVYEGASTLYFYKFHLDFNFE